jgi:RNA polymerase sigma-70 factor (ECF subfamily)
LNTFNNINNGSDDSIEQFLIQSEKRAFIMARIATKDEEVALDIVQDAMIKLVSKYSNKQSHEWPPLFYRILQSRINDWYRRQKVRNRWRSWLGKEIANEDESRDSPLENHSNENEQLPDDDVHNHEFSESLEVAVSALPLRQKQAFMLRAWEEYSTLETSQIMKCSEGSVKTHYSRALVALRHSLKEYSL